MGKPANASAIACSLLLGGGIAASLPALEAAAADAGEALVNSKCAACHAADEKGGLDRISASRRTPEGWAMTVARMSFAHGVQLTSEDRAAIVKYLSDKYGLAPEETALHRYIIEKTPSVVEHPENKLIADTCARCHSYGRIAVQRRTEDDWRKLVHFHVGQYPAIEIQAGGRDRNWFEIATGEVAKELGKVYGLESEAWSMWKASKTMSPEGQWRVVGHEPGRGSYEGNAVVSGTGDDHYTVSMTLRYEDGSTETAEGKAITYAGHEWRGTVQQGGKEVNQVFSLLDGGKELKGRWFDAQVDSLGGTLHAAKMGAGSRVLSTTPRAIRADSKGTLTINGVSLSGDVDLGAKIKVGKVVERTDDKVVVEYETPASLATEYVGVRVGDASNDKILAAYQQIDYVKITPAHAMARVGDGGGTQPKVPAQLEAIGVANGPDGKAGTDDDVQLGAMPAAWKLENLNEIAEQMQDLKYVGEITKSGRFIPAVAGPNPERKYSTNNAGELKVTATVKDGGRDVSGSAPLIVTVQRFNDPPIR